MKPQLNINNSFPKKSLGQNFIQNKDFIFKLSSLIQSDNDTNIFEIGPGMGALTEQLAKKKFKNLYLIEKDFLLFQKLEDRFKKDSNIFISNSDALEYNYEVINKNQKSIIVGNLPFNISSNLLMNWIFLHKWPPLYKKMYLMFQKEVGERILAIHGSKQYGRLSVITQSRCKVKKLIVAKSKIFNPEPKVDGIVLELTPHSKNIDMDIRNLEIIVRNAFSQRRKKIKTTLSSYTDYLDKLSINSDLRPENLSVTEYCELAKLMK